MLDWLVREFWRCERGAAIVETAIVLPVGVLLLVGGLELGRGLSYHHAADKSVRNAARYLARIPDTVPLTDALAEQLVTADNALGISSDDLVDVNVTVDSERLAD